MMTRLTKTVTIMALTTPLLAATLSGCVWRSKTKEVEREQGAPVVVTPPPSGSPVVMSPGTTPTAPAPSVGTGQATDRVVYPDGRWQLYGDGRSTPYYWVWIPAGSSLTQTPIAPARPSGTPTRTAVTYPEGRWQLFGDGGRNSQYYWVWIPSGLTPPSPPLPPPAG